MCLQPVLNHYKNCCYMLINEENITSVHVMMNTLFFTILFNCQG
jgi:hypothetical protein